MVLGRQPAFVRRFNEALAGRRGHIVKFYRTLSAGRPPVGVQGGCFWLIAVSLWPFS